MSEATNPGNPYQASDKAALGGDVRVRPSGLTIICVLAIVLGVFTLLGSLQVILTLTFFEAVEGLTSSLEQPGLSSEANDMFKELQAKMGATTKQLRFPMLALLLLYLAASVAMMYGGGKGLGMNSAALKVLIVAFVAGIVLELVWASLQGVLLVGNLEAIDGMLVEAKDKSEQFSTLLGLQRLAVVFSTVLAGGITLAKLLYFLLSLRYLRKDDVKKLFAEPA